MRVFPPTGGIYDGESLSDQPDGTTRDAVNVRGTDPVTGRTRLSQRCGTSKYTTAEVVNNTSKVRRLVSVSADGRNVTFVNATSQTATAETEVSTAFDCASGRVDRASNLYVVDGKESLIKYSADGKEVWRAELPHKAQNHTVRAMWVGDDDVVYAGVSAGGRMGDAAIYRFRQYFNAKQEVRAELYWEFTTKMFVEDMAVKDGVLYTAQNNPEENRAELVTYGFLASDKPVELWRREIPYPAMSLAVSQKDGSIFIASDANTTRGSPATDPLHTGTYTDATIADLIPNYDRRIWCWLDGQDIDGNGTNNDAYKHGDPVNVWTDKSGNGRNLFSLPGTRTIPFLNKTACSGEAGVQFAYDTSSGPRCWMTTGSNDTVAPEAASQQRTIVPGYTGAGWVMFVVVRWDTEVTTNRDKMPLMSFHHAGGPSSGISDARDDVIFLNSTVNAGNQYRIQPALDAGRCYYYKGLTSTAPPTQATPTSNQDITDAGGAGNIPAPHVKSNVAILTIVNGSNDPALGIASGIRVNGFPRAVMSGTEQARTMTAPMVVGDVFTYNVTTGGGSASGGTGGTTWDCGGFRGTIMEILVFRDYQVTVGGAKALMDLSESTTAISEMQRVEGRLAWKWGVSHLLRGLGGATVIHPYRYATGPPKIDTFAANSSVPALYGVGSMLSKYSSTQGSLKWVVADPGASGANNTGLGGLGYGVAVTPAGYVVSCGPKSRTPVSSPSSRQKLQTYALVRGVYDKGDTAETDWSLAGANTTYAWAWAYAPFDGADEPSAWVIGTTTFGEYLYKYPRLGACQVDSNSAWGGTLSEIATVPLILGDGSTGEQRASSVGVWNMKTDSVGDVQRNPDISITLPQGQLARAAMPDLSIPVYSPQSNIFYPEIVASFSAQATTAVLTCGANFAAAGTVRVGTVTYTFVDPAAPVSNYQVDLGATLAISLQNLADAINKANAFAGTPATNYFAATPVNLDYACVLVTATTITVRKKATNDDTTLSTSNGLWTGGNVNTNTIHRTRTVLTTAVTADTRIRALVAASGVNIRKISEGGVPSAISGGEGVISADSQYVSATTLFGEAFFSDGVSKNTLVYNSITDRMQPLAAKIGKAPERCRLLGVFNSRLVMLRGSSEPENIFFSKRGDARNFDFYPPKPASNQAIWLSLSTEVGLIPDIPQSFVSWQDDLAFVGCMNSVFRMTGDPAQGGTVHLVTDKTGTAFGDKAWAKDERGNSYFFGYPHGDVWVVSPTGGAINMTETTIPTRLRGIDFTKYTVELVWDSRRHGLWVIPVPYGNTAELVTSYFWDSRLKAWWSDDYVSAARQTTCTQWIAGETERQRDVLLGCMDGHIRRYDDTAADDDGVAIDSRVTIGPIQDPKRDTDLLFDDIGATLSQAQDPVRYEIYAANTPEDLGPVVASGEFMRGSNSALEARCCASQIFTKLRSASVGSRWSIEDMSVEVYPAGKARDE